MVAGSGGPIPSKHAGSLKKHFTLRLATPNIDEAENSKMVIKDEKMHVK